MIDPQTIDIREILPQQPPFVMVERLTRVDESSAVTETLISSDNIFASEGYLSPLGLTENIAQTCAAKIGFINKYVYHKPIAIGVIGAIRNLTFEALPSVGETVTTFIRASEEVFGMTLVEAECRGNDNRLLCSATMKIAIRNNEEALS